MKAYVLQELKTPLKQEERDDLRPDPGEVIVQLKAAALNRRDYWITQGMYPGIEMPVVLGSDGAGVVSRCGPGVDESWQGREVIVNPGLDWGPSESFQGAEFNILGLPRDGTLATQVMVPAGQLVAKPAHLSWQEAAALPLAGVTAYRAVFSQSELKEGQTMLVTGIGGGVATFALQFGVAAGASVWVTSSSAEKIQRAKELGATDGFNYREENWWKRSDEPMPSLDVVIDSAGGKGYAALLSLAAPGGRIVSYGSTAGQPERLDMFKVFWKQLRLLGSTMGSPADFDAMIRFVEHHQVRPIVDQVLPLDDVNRALQSMATSPQFGKFVLTMD